MPKNQPLPAFVAGLTAELLAQIIAGLDRSLQVSMPRFKIENYLNLNDTLKAMGNACRVHPRSGRLRYEPHRADCGSAVQRGYLHVDEHGSEAAAVTGISAVLVSAMPAVSFDHPFLFLIRDTTTATILSPRRYKPRRQDCCVKRSRAGCMTTPAGEAGKFVTFW